ncbi:MAG TPA: hypothetical protein VK857_03435 [Desulforhopalus sp.]|nr:hypothetical protein [Desulforhopalus sp.]
MRATTEEEAKNLELLYFPLTGHPSLKAKFRIFTKYRCEISPEAVNNDELATARQDGDDRFRGKSTCPDWSTDADFRYWWCQMSYENHPGEEM